MQEKNKQLVLHLNIFADSCPQIWLQVFLRMRGTRQLFVKIKLNIIRDLTE